MLETLRSSANQKSIHLSIVICGRQALSPGGAMVSNEAGIRQVLIGLILQLG